MTYDCFGAGQYVTQVLYKGKSWHQDKKNKEQFFKVFLKIEEFFSMKYYLLQAGLEKTSKPIRHEIDKLIKENEEMAAYSVEALLQLDLEAYQDRVNAYLQQAMDLSYRALHQKTEKVHQSFYLGKNFKTKTNQCSKRKSAYKIA